MSADVDYWPGREWDRHVVDLLLPAVLDVTVKADGMVPGISIVSDDGSRVLAGTTGDDRGDARLMTAIGEPGRYRVVVFHQAQVAPSARYHVDVVAREARVLGGAPLATRQGPLTRATSDGVPRFVVFVKAARVPQWMLAWGADDLRVSGSNITFLLRAEAGGALLDPMWDHDMAVRPSAVVTMTDRVRDVFILTGERRHDLVVEGVRYGTWSAGPVLRARIGPGSDLELPVTAGPDALTVVTGEPRIVRLEVDLVAGTGCLIDIGSSGHAGVALGATLTEPGGRVLAFVPASAAGGAGSLRVLPRVTGTHVLELRAPAGHEPIDVVAAVRFAPASTTRALLPPDADQIVRVLPRLDHPAWRTRVDGRPGEHVLVRFESDSGTEVRALATQPATGRQSIQRARGCPLEFVAQLDEAGHLDLETWADAEWSQAGLEVLRTELGGTLP